jgi:hypothetical protein
MDSPHDEAAVAPGPDPRSPSPATTAARHREGASRVFPRSWATNPAAAGPLGFPQPWAGSTIWVRPVACGRGPNAAHTSFLHFYPFSHFFSNYKFQGIPLRFQKFMENRIKFRKLQTKFHWNPLE